MTLICYPDEAAWVEGAAEQIASRLRRAIAERGRATLMLAGGGTPRPVYEALATRRDVDWNQVLFLWGDERHLPHDHPRSNYGMAHESLLAPLGLDATAPSVYPMPTGDRPEQDARRYEDSLRQLFSVGPAVVPRLDVVLLGMGSDGHTASLFPGSPGLDEQERMVIHNPTESPEPRLTVTFPLLDQARALLVLVRGADKAERLAEVLDEREHGYPIERLDPHDGELVWLVDAAAAREVG